MRCCSSLKFIFSLVLVFSILSIPCFATSPPAYGLAWDSGTVGGSDAWLYCPRSNYDSFGLTIDGYLFNVTSSTVSGRLYIDKVEYIVQAPAFSIPRYRRADSSSYQWTDLYFSPSGAGNLQVATSDALSFGQLYPYVLILLLGVVLCILFITRFKN